MIKLASIQLKLNKYKFRYFCRTVKKKMEADQEKQINKQIKTQNQSGIKKTQDHNHLQKQQEKSQIFNTILDYLKEKNIPYKLMEHQSAQTSIQSAKIRNTPLQWGSKTMLVRGTKKKENSNKKQTQEKQPIQQNLTDDIWMLLYRANHKLSWNKIRKIQELGKKCKMLTQEELLNIFKLKPGGVPPFANLLKIKGIVDSKFQLQKTMAFNAGLRDKSIIMDTCNFELQYFKRVSITQDDKKQQMQKQVQQKQQ